MGLLKTFIGLLTSIVNASNHKKCASLSNKKCTTQLTLINIRSNEYTQGLCYYVFVINLDKYVRSCNALNDLSKKVYVPNAIEDLNLNVFNIITRINESKTLTKHIPCKCKFRFDGRKCNSDQKGNNDKRQCKWKNVKEHHVCKKDCVWNPVACSWNNDKYFESVTDDSVITSYKSIEETKAIPTKTVPTNVREKKDNL